MAIVPMKALLEAGVHFGHRTRRWNPQMRPYIFTERNGIHILDLQQTIGRLDRAYRLVSETVANGGTVLFVGTKKQAQESIVTQATRCSMPYVIQRWLGGTLTNWRTIRQRIDHLLDLEKKQSRGEFARLIKKEALMLEREIERLNRRFGGLKEMRRLPNLVFMVDVRREAIAVKEANILGIPIIAMVDTNCDPNPIDHVIPSNDDAIRAIKLVSKIIADAVLEGQAIYDSLQAEEEVEAGEEALERYLGPSTLAKLRDEAMAEGDVPEAGEAGESAPAEIAEEAGAEAAVEAGAASEAAALDVGEAAEEAAETVAGSEVAADTEEAETTSEEAGAELEVAALDVGEAAEEAEETVAGSEVAADAEEAETASGEAGAELEVAAVAGADETDVEAEAQATAESGEELAVEKTG